MRKVYEMKKYIIALIGSVMLLSTTANANTTRIQVETVSSTAITQQVVQKTPSQQCSIVDVPIYSTQNNASTGDVLFGAIVGGVIGNQFGKGKGNDAATALGAIIGADAANKKKSSQTIVGYKQVQQCNTIFIETVADKIVGYNTTFRDSNGQTYVYQTGSQWKVGTIAFLNVTTTLN
jgi:uncharacterized protein YcfJ|tara:strand:- start:2065 stop:2598 length:534 start_codon:yes stop_codon:yes gene_type:complete